MSEKFLWEAYSCVIKSGTFHRLEEAGLGFESIAGLEFIDLGTFAAPSVVWSVALLSYGIFHYSGYLHSLIT